MKPREPEEESWNQELANAWLLRMDGKFPVEGTVRDTRSIPNHTIKPGMKKSRSPIQCMGGAQGAGSGGSTTGRRRGAGGRGAHGLPAGRLVGGSSWLRRPRRLLAGLSGWLVLPSSQRSPQKLIVINEAEYHPSLPPPVKPPFCET